jgi:hypothetical protein
LLKKQELIGHSLVSVLLKSRSQVDAVSDGKIDIAEAPAEYTNSTAEPVAADRVLLQSFTCLMVQLSRSWVSYWLVHRMQTEYKYPAGSVTLAVNPQGIVEEKVIFDDPENDPEPQLPAS